MTNGEEYFFAVFLFFTLSQTKLRDNSKDYPDNILVYKAFPKNTLPPAAPFFCHPKERGKEKGARGDPLDPRHAAKLAVPAGRHGAPAFPREICGGSLAGIQ